MQIIKQLQFIEKKLTAICSKLHSLTFRVF